MARFQFLGFVPYVFLAAPVNLFALYNTGQFCLAVTEQLANSPEQVSFFLLRDAQLASQLHARNPLDVGRRLVEHDGPCLTAELVD